MTAPEKEYLKQFTELFPNYYYEAHEFFNYCAVDGKSFSEETIREYQLSMPRRLKYGTYNKKLAAAKKVVLEWVKKTNPKEYPATAFHLKGIKGMKRTDKSIRSDRWHTPEQIRELLRASGRKTEAIIYFLVCSGLRRAEAIGIQLDDIVLTDEAYNVRVNGKGNKERTIQVPIDAVQKAMGVFSGKKYLFESRTGKPYGPDQLSSMVSDAGKKIGMKTSPHRMRHTFATRFLQENPGKFKELSVHLGHATIQMTMDNYAHNKMLFDDLQRSTSAFIK